MSYGGEVSLVRCDGDNLRTSHEPVSGEDTSGLKIKNYDDYQYQKSATSWYFAAKNPGSWFNDLKVCIIDGASDQTITPVDPADLVGMSVGAAVDVPLNNVKIASSGIMVKYIVTRSPFFIPSSFNPLAALHTFL